MDLKFALRSLWKTPGFTIVAIAILALGIGANTAMFSVVNAVLLRPLNYPDPDRLVTVSSLWTKSGQHGQVSAPDFHDWHDRSTSFSAIAYYAAGSTAVATGSSAEYVRTAVVTPEFFRVFAVSPVIGRVFTSDEEKPGGGAAVLVSHAFWQSHFAGSPETLGQTLRMFNRKLPIVACYPSRSAFPATAMSGCPQTPSSPKPHPAPGTTISSWRA